MSELMVSDESKTTAEARRSPLRIGMVAPPWFALPPRGYGGTEAVVASLVDGLVDRGHEVVLVASGPHRTKATEYHRVYDVPPTERLGEPVPEVVTAAKGLKTPKERLAAFQNVEVESKEGNTYDEYFGYAEAP